jgi:hypothetical protein
MSSYVVVSSVMAKDMAQRTLEAVRKGRRSRSAPTSSPR